MTESSMAVMRKVAKGTLIYSMDTPLSCLAVNPKAEVLAVAGRNIFQVFSIFTEKFVPFHRGKSQSRFYVPQSPACSSIDKAPSAQQSTPSQVTSVFSPGESSTPSSSSGTAQSSIRPSTVSSPAVTCMKTGVKSTPRSASVTDIAWSCADNILATGSTGGDIMLWDVAHNMTQVSCFSGHTRSIHCIAYHPSNPYELISASQDGLLKMFDTRDPNPGTSYRCFAQRGASPSPVRDVNYSPKHTYFFAAAQENGIVSIWDTRQQARPYRAFQGHSCSITTLDWHPNWQGSGRNWLATAGAGDHVIRVWNFDQTSPGQPGCPQLISTLRTSNVSRVRWRPGFPSQLVSSCNQTFDLSAYLWDLKRPYVPYASFEEHKGIVTSIAWSPCETEYFYTVGRDGLLVRHCIADGLRPTETATPVALAVSSRGSMAHAVSRDRVLLHRGLPYGLLVSNAARLSMDPSGLAVVNTSLVTQSPFYRALRTTGTVATGTAKPNGPGPHSPPPPLTIGSTTTSVNVAVTGAPPPGFYAAPSILPDREPDNKSTPTTDGWPAPTLCDDSLRHVNLLPPMGSAESAHLFVSQAQSLLFHFEPSHKSLLRSSWLNWRITFLPELIAALARNYRFSGSDFDKICTHNATISLRLGQSFLIQFWCLLRSLYGRLPCDPSRHPAPHSPASYFSAQLQRLPQLMNPAPDKRISLQPDNDGSPAETGPVLSSIEPSGRSRPTAVKLTDMVAALGITFPRYGEAGDEDDNLSSGRQQEPPLELSNVNGSAGSVTRNVGLQYLTPKPTSDPTHSGSHMFRRRRSAESSDFSTVRIIHGSTKDSIGHSSSRHTSEVLYPSKDLWLGGPKHEVTDQKHPISLLDEDFDSLFRRRHLAGGSTLSRIERHRTVDTVSSTRNTLPHGRQISVAGLSHDGAGQLIPPLSVSLTKSITPESTAPKITAICGHNKHVDLLFHCPLAEDESSLPRTVKKSLIESDTKLKGVQDADDALLVRMAHMPDEAFQTRHMSTVVEHARRGGMSAQESRGKPPRPEPVSDASVLSSLRKVDGGTDVLGGHWCDGSEDLHSSNRKPPTTDNPQETSVSAEATEGSDTVERETFQLLAPFAPRALVTTSSRTRVPNVLTGNSMLTTTTNVPHPELSRLVAQWFCELVDTGNVQTVCTALLALSGKVNLSEWIGVARVDAWFHAYLELLSRFRLWNVSAKVIKQCGHSKSPPGSFIDSSAIVAERFSYVTSPANRSSMSGADAHRRPTPSTEAAGLQVKRSQWHPHSIPSPQPPLDEEADQQAVAPSVSSLSRTSTTLCIHCGKCSKPLVASEATKRLTGHVGWACARHTTTAVMSDPANITCALCHLTVRGLFVWCRGCCHGGHLEHMQAWLSRRTECPAGCGHRCEYG